MWGRREKIVGNGEVLGGKKWGKTPYGEPQHQLWLQPVGSKPNFRKKTAPVVHGLENRVS